MTDWLVWFSVMIDHFAQSIIVGHLLQKSLHMRALKTFKDDFGVVRKNGEEWLVKLSDTETHIPHVYEEVSYDVLSANVLRFCGFCSWTCWILIFVWIQAKLI